MIIKGNINKTIPVGLQRKTSPNDIPEKIEYLLLAL
jgi:hypothetical protein